MRTSTFNATILACTVLAGGCFFHHGPPADGLGARMAPAGVQVDVRLASTAGQPVDRLTGELLEVRDDGVLVLNRLIMLVDYAAITRLRPSEGDAMAPGVSGDPAEVANQLRLVSRYPHGIRNDVLQQLLRGLDQVDVMHIRNVRK